MGQSIKRRDYFRGQGEWRWPGQGQNLKWREMDELESVLEEDLPGLPAGLDMG